MRHQIVWLMPRAVYRVDALVHCTSWACIVNTKLCRVSVLVHSTRWATHALKIQNFIHIYLCLERDLLTTPWKAAQKMVTLEEVMHVEYHENPRKTPVKECTGCQCMRRVPMGACCRGKQMGLD